MHIDNGIVVECDDEYLESPMPQSAAHNRRIMKSPTGLITCENVDTESPVKLLRLKKQVISPTSDNTDKVTGDSLAKANNAPSRNAQNELLAKFRKITGTQDKSGQGS